MSKRVRQSHQLPSQSSVVILACRDDHHEAKSFFFFLLKRVSWGFSSHSLCSGGAKHVVATWLVLRGGFNAPLCVTLGFPAIFFQFSVLSFLNFPPFLFLLHFSLSFATIVVLHFFLQVAILIAISCVLLSLGLHFLGMASSSLGLLFVE